MFDALKRHVHGKDRSGDEAEGTAAYGNAQDVLADYEIGQKLGEGGYGIVHQVHQRSAEAGFDVAVKAIPLSLVKGDHRDGMSYVYKRLDRLRRFNENPHPNIIKILDFRVSEQDLFVFLELARGKDLFEKASAGVSEDDARKAARSLCKALAYCHEQGLVHRDIKLENAFFRAPDSPFEDILLADFSAMVEAAPDEPIRGLAGSYGYQSPEMAAGKSYTSITDEWSLGITLYELLTSHTPYKNTEAAAIREETVNSKIRYPKVYWENISVEARHFVQRLLCRNAADRMTAKQALSHPWLRAIEDPSSAATSPEAQKEEQEMSAESDPVDLSDDVEELPSPTRSGTPPNSRPLYDRPVPISDIDESDQGTKGQVTYDLARVLLGKLPGSHLLRFQQMYDHFQ